MEREEEEPLDPRVQIELERLNSSSDEINKLENKLEEANALFRSTLSDSTASLKLLAGRLGATVEKARPFYEAREISRSTQLACQRAAVQFQRASVLHQNARETIQLAEQRFLPRLPPPVPFQFDSAWQEMLNHATMKLFEAERLKTSSEDEHLRRAKAFADAQKKLKKLERSLEKSIARARPYFEQREVVQHELLRQKTALQQLQRAVSLAKARYSASLRELEHISEQIHEQRRLRELEPDLVPIELDTCDLGSVSGVTESATSDYEEDFKLSQEQQYWTEMREQIEALSAALPRQEAVPSLPSASDTDHDGAGSEHSEPPLAEELSVARLIARRRVLSGGEVESSPQQVASQADTAGRTGPDSADPTESHSAGATETPGGQTDRRHVKLGSSPSESEVSNETMTSGGASVSREDTVASGDRHVIAAAERSKSGTMSTADGSGGVGVALKVRSVSPAESAVQADRSISEETVHLMNRSLTLAGDEPHPEVVQASLE